MTQPAAPKPQLLRSDGPARSGTRLPPVPRWTAPPLPEFFTARSANATEQPATAAPAGWYSPNATPISMQAAAPQISLTADVLSQPAHREIAAQHQQPAVDFSALSAPELAALAPTDYALGTTPAAAAEKRPDPSALMRRVAAAQVVLALGLLTLAPALMLLTGKPSAPAFALHGIGATLVLMVATMAMHKAYPILRGGVRSWPALKALLGKLALCSVVQALSSGWILYYYHGPTGPGHALAETTPLVDQLAMQVKVFCGLGALLLFVAAWWSARSVSGDRGDRAALAPVSALIAGWLFMIAAFVLGMAITYVMPV